MCDDTGSKAHTVAFLDTDVLSVGTGLLEAAGGGSVRVKPADFRSWNANNDATWKRLYHALRITPPTVRRAWLLCAWWGWGVGHGSAARDWSCSTVMWRDGALVVHT